MIIRLTDILLALLALLASLPVIALLWVIGLLDMQEPLFRQERMGKNQKPFVLVKFRTMPLGTESIATHLADAAVITGYGRFLRRTKLDELPQLWNVLRGEMSLVGPRPCLSNQEQLIVERSSRGVFEVLPGITGLAQIEGIDMSTPEILAKTDAEMIKTLNLLNYFKYLGLTVLGKGFGDRLSKKS